MQPQGTMGQGPVHSAHKRHVNWNGRIYRLEWFTLTVALVAILIAMTVWLALSNANIVKGSEASHVNSKEYQAVFLNGGATSGSVAYTTYFGHITRLNSGYMELTNVYYLTTSTDQNASPQLTKLGCQQLHSPEDAMFINRSQVAFWENLKDSGKVVQAIKQFQQQNPNGPNCNATANTSSSTSNTSTGTSGTTTQNATTNKP